MSWQASQFVFELPALAPNGEPITSTDVAVLAALANRLNAKTMQCNPKIETISRESKASEATVHRVIKGLQAKGILQVHKRSVPGKGLRSNFYVFIGFDPSKYTGTTDDTGVSQPDSGVSSEWQAGVSFEGDRGLTPRRTNQKVNQNQFNHSLPNGSESAGAFAPPRAARNSSSKSVETAEDVALKADCNRVYDAIVAEHALVKGHCIKLRQDLPSYVKRFGADDLIAWHRAACAARNGNYVPISFATHGLRGWIAAGRPDVEPDPHQRSTSHGRNTQLTAVVAAGQKYGDNDRYERAAREHAERLRALGEAV